MIMKRWTDFNTTANHSKVIIVAPNKVLPFSATGRYALDNSKVKVFVVRRVIHLLRQPSPRKDQDSESSLNLNCVLS